MSVKDYTFTALRSKFALVFQKAVLFKNTVRENMKWGNPTATDEQIYKALEIAQIKDFIDENPLGLDKMIEQGGKNLSGGQRQRLTVARALVANPEILVLDDSSSALDYATDLKMRRAIKDNCKNTTVIIISQRAAAVKTADKIIALDDGKVVGIGTHEELYNNCETYREICNSQVSKETK